MVGLRTCALLVVLAGGPVRGARGEEPPAAPAPAPPGFVGMELAPAFFLTAEERARFGLEATAGIVVNHVVKDGPAFQAGVRFGDLLLGFAGKPVPAAEPPADLADHGAIFHAHETWLAAFRAQGHAVRPGAEVEVVLRRAGKEVVLKPLAVDGARLKTLLEDVAPRLYPDPPAPPPGEKAPPVRGISGLQLGPVELMTSGWRRLLAPVPERGIVVHRVWPTGPAARAGIRRRDVVTSYGGRPAPDTSGMNADQPDGQQRWVAAFREWLGERTAGEEVEIRVQRADTSLTFRVKLVAGPALERAAYVEGHGNRV